MPKGYHHLTRDQRCQLYTLKKRGDSVKIISNELGVHKSTIYRELERNTGQRGYRFKQADEKAVKATLRRPSDDFDSQPSSQPFSFQGCRFEKKYY